MPQGAVLAQGRCCGRHRVSTRQGAHPAACALLAPAVLTLATRTSFTGALLCRTMTATARLAYGML